MIIIVSIVSIITFVLGWFMGLITGYATFKWSLRQDGYFIKYDKSKDSGKGRYQILQEVDFSVWSEDDE